MKETHSTGQPVTDPVQLRWIADFKIYNPDLEKDAAAFYFEDAVFNNKSTMFPYYQGTKKILPGEKVIPTFQQCFFEEAPVEELTGIPHVADLSDSIFIETSIGTQQKEQYLFYSFVPLRKNPVTGKIERLKFFTLRFTSTFSPISRLKSGTTRAFAVQSVLQTGNWSKFYVPKSGIYKITYADLKKIGISDPENVRIYGNGGTRLPEVYNAANTCDDPEEIPVYMIKGTDGIFNEGDFILFYAEGPVTYTYDKNSKTYQQQKHPLLDKISYFITSSAGGKKIAPNQVPSGSPAMQVTSFDAFAFHEENTNNLLKSGQGWFGEDFKIQTSYDFSFSFTDRIVNEPVSLHADVIGRSGYENYFNFYQGGNQLVGSVKIAPVNMSSSLSTYAKASSYEGTFEAPSGNVTLRITYNKNGDPNGTGWLDRISLVARQNLNFNGGQLLFRDSRSTGEGTAEFRISNSTSDMLVWNVTDIHNVYQVQGTWKNNLYSFNALTSNLEEYAAFDSKTVFLTPEFNTKLENQNLHAAAQPDLIIVSSPLFLEQAQELANLHFEKDHLKSLIATPEQIYNEFSSGMPDPAAIRNFVKMFYDRGSSYADRPKYLLILGDGSFDNTLPYKTDSKYQNLVITYESINSLNPTSTFVSDDYFGILDDGESIVQNPDSDYPSTTALLDIGVGRLPVNTQEEANAVIQKIKAYYSQSAFGDWRNRICFVADDEDENVHMEQADELATYTAKNYPLINIEKIYLDSYQQVSSSTGQSYPEVNKAIQNQLNRGLLIFNYTGHGGERGLAHEQIMRQNEDIKLWNNEIYPLFITATCDFSRFDSYDQTTAGEDVLLNPHGGAVALLSTNRLVYSAPNFVLNQQFYKQAFVKAEDNPDFRLGDIIRKTKNGSGTDINKLNFALLGDPALPLALPKLAVVTDSINSKTTDDADTVHSYNRITVKGHVESNGVLEKGFNGIVMPTLYDKSKKITTLANDGGTPFEFDLQNKILYKGKVSVKNGEFSVSFLLPRDMDYSYGKGRLSYYAWSPAIDASGYYSGLTIGGVSSSVFKDESGPVVKLFMNDTTFHNGGVTNEFPTLLARIKDENGINPGGNGIGHDIVAILDGDIKQSYILNSFYESDLDNFKNGSVSFKFPQITPGEHFVTFKIWDIFNNSSQETLNFRVLKENNLAIQNVLSFPNPIADYTNFSFEHNQPSEDLDVTIEIYDLPGRKVNEIRTHLSGTGFNSGPIRWDATDRSGNKVPGGIYIYRVRVSSSKGSIFSSAKKIVVIKP